MSGVGFDVEFWAGLGNDLANHQKKKNHLETQVYQQIIPGITMTLTAGAGTIDRPDLLGPVHGWMMEYQRLTVAGYTAGTVSCTIDGGEPIAIPGAGTQYFGKGDLILPSTSRLIFTATGITGTVTVYGAATMFPTDFYPFYVS